MIYITGDMYGAAEYGRNRLSFHSWPLGRELTRDDVVIVAGDFGSVSYTHLTLPTLCSV